VNGRVAMMRDVTGMQQEIRLRFDRRNLCECSNKRGVRIEEAVRELARLLDMAVGYLCDQHLLD
jgi:hypothetical protein